MTVVASQTHSGRAAWVAVAWWAACGPVVLLALHWTQGVWWAIAAYHAGCLAATWAAGAGVAWGRRPAGMRLAALACGSALVVGMSVEGVVRAGWDLSAVWPRWHDWGLTPPADRVWLFYYVTANPWIEERFWRGTVLGPSVRARLGPRAARAVAAVGFVHHHAAVTIATFGVLQGALLCIPILAAGCVWTWMRERSGILWWSVASHIGADLGLAIAYLRIHP